MKKIISVIIVLAMLMPMSFILSGCTEKTVEISSLSGYTVVYPAEWENWQTEEVEALCNAIEKVTSQKVNAVPDTSEKNKKEIILASSSREKKISQADQLESDLDYMVAVSGNDIILGGKGFFADMRAIYRFINDYLGYDDINDTVSEPCEIISGTRIYGYEEPDFAVLVDAEGETPLKNISVVSDLVNAGFNMIRLDTETMSDEVFCRYGKWCARFGLRIIQRALYDAKNDTFVSHHLERAIENPIIFGHFVKQPGVYKAGTFFGNEEKVNYKETFGKYGWKLVVGLRQLDEDYLEKAKDAFRTADVIASEINIPWEIHLNKADYYNNYDGGIRFVEEIAGIARENGTELWVNITNDESSIAPEINKYPMYYGWDAGLAMTFGATGIEYTFLKRGVVLNGDSTRSDKYETIKKTNENAKKLYEAIKDCEYEGTAVLSEEYHTNKFVLMEEPFDGVGEYIEDVMFINTQYLTGFFRNKETGEKTVIFTDAAVPEDKISSSVSFDMLCIKCNGNETYELTEEGWKAAESTPMAEGYAVLTVEQNGTAAIRIK